MGQERRNSETPTVEALVNAFERGAVSRRDFLRRAGLLGLTAAGAGALADAAAPARARAQTTQKNELVVAQGGDISKFDPHFSTSSNDIRVSFNLFDNLTSRHPDGKLYPGLATEWKLQGQTTWAFKLRQGVKFHNGDPFTSADAKFSLERHLRPGRQDDGGDRLHDDRPDRGAGPVHARHPHQEAGSAAPRAARLLRRPDRAEEVPGVGGQRHLQRQAGGHGARALRRPGSRTTRPCSRPTRTTGAARSTSTASIFRPIPETAPRVAALLKGEVDIDHPAPARPGRARERQRHHARWRARSTPGLYVLARQQQASRRSTTRSSSRRCRSPSTARPS